MPRSSARPPRRSALSSRRTQAVLFLLLNTVVWGAAFPILKPGLEVTTPFRFLFERFVVAGVLSLPILFWFIRKNKKILKHLPLILSLEIIGTTVALGVLYTGVALTSAIESSLIASTTPVFTTIAGIVFLREKEERLEWLGLSLAMIGTLLLVVEPIVYGKMQMGESSVLGNGLILLQNILIAGYYIMAKRWYRQLPKMFVTSVSFWVGAVSFGLLAWTEALVQNQSFADLLWRDLHSPAVWVAASYMGVFGSIIGLTAYIKGQDGMEASEASLFTYLQPLVAIPIAWILLGESVSGLMIVALIVIFGGVSVAELRWNSTKRKLQIR